MAHYTRSYEGLTGQAKHDAAITDIIDYLGEERFDLITDLCREDKPTHPGLGWFMIAVSLSGVEGYPVKAWYAHIWGEDALREAEAVQQKQLDEIGLGETA
jgi:hypothetical protein